MPFFLGITLLHLRYTHQALQILHQHNHLLTQTAVLRGDQAGSRRMSHQGLVLLRKISLKMVVNGITLVTLNLV